MTTAPGVTRHTTPPSTDDPILGWFQAPLDSGPGPGFLDRPDATGHTWLATQLECAGVEMLVLDGAEAGPDPLAVAPLVVAHTERLAVVVPVDPVGLPPWMAARAIATLDHLADGRVGWYLTGPGADCTERANEYVDLLRRLWASWDADALVMDRAANVYVDHTKVRPIDFTGRFYASRGPLNTLRPPQGAPPLVQPLGGPDRAAPIGNSDAFVGGAGPGHLLVVTPVTDAVVEDTTPDGTHLLGGPVARIVDRLAALLTGTGAAGVLLRPADGTRRGASELIDELVPALHAAGIGAPSAGGMLRSRLTAATRR
ncbi:LLM class flavin-dependent oxidoreductase [Pseudonocardia sp. NPDC049635]|uniref:LLM class flavin-dependent oxidoreductase n=1 Tax=Pseudonocardia sp. NPDC049635 TaxID=3155506 RepID=UPI0033CCE02A